MLKRVGLLSTLLLLLACFETGNGMSKEKAEEFFKDPEVIELTLAAAKGDIQKIDKLVAQGVDVNTRGKDNMTPLLWMLQSKNLAGYKRLLEHGADPNIQAEERYSVMEFVAGGDSPEFLKLALEHGGDPNLVDPYIQETIIFDAIRQERKQNIRILAEAGANLNFQTRTGATPLHSAAAVNQYDIVYELLQLGADYTIENNFGKTIVHFIENNNIDPDSELYEWREKVIKFLRERGVEVNPRIP